MVAWAVSAKNALHNCYGYSPNQLVFGGKTRIFLQCSLIIHLRLEGQICSKIIANNLNAMHAARAAFIKSEAYEKRRRALRAKTRTATSLIYETGDIVYFKREKSNLWKGPGTAIGTENKQILVKYGGTYLRVHACRLQHAKDVKM